MEDSHWPKNTYHWTPYGRRRRERSHQSWKNQETDFMRSRNMKEKMADDRYISRLGIDRRKLPA